MVNKTAYLIYLICLIFAPLAFGSVEKWSTALLQLLTVFGFLLYLAGLVINRERVIRTIGILPLVFLLFFLVIQLVPLPAAVLKIIGGTNFENYRPVIEAADKPFWGAISLHPKATLLELMRLGSYVLAYILTIQLLADNPNRLKFTLRFIVCLGAFTAFWGIIQHVSFPDKILGLRNPPPNANPFGPWVNANQFCGFMEIIFPLSLALFLFHRPLVRSDDTLREKFVSFFTMPGIHLHIYMGVSALIMLTAVFYSLCRGGILSILAGAALFAVLYRIRFPHKARKVFLVFSLLAVLAVSWLGWDVVLSEFSTGIKADGSFHDGRIALWGDSVKMILDFPLLGAGFGSFLSLYPQYKTIGDNLIYEHAHNDYLELLTDGGIVSLFLVCWFVIVVLRHVWKMVRVRRDHYAVLVGIGGICSIFAILCHAVTDFNLHNTAIGYYFFVLCGIAVSVVNCRFSYASSGTIIPKIGVLPRRTLIAGTLSASVLLVLFNLCFVLAQNNYNRVKDIYLTTNLSESLRTETENRLREAVRFDPLEGVYAYKLASVLWFENEKNRAREMFLRAARMNPLEGIFLQKLGFLQEDFEQGQKLVAEGYRRALSKDKLVLGYIEWLLLHERRVEATEILHKRILLADSELRKIAPLLNGYGFTIDEISEILPDTGAAWLSYAKYSERQNSLDDAFFFIEGAGKRILTQNDDFDPQDLLEVARFYNRQGQEDKAVMIVRKGIERRPDFAPYHVLLGIYYEHEGILYRAKEEFEQALILDPGNKMVLSRLRKMGGADSY